MHAPISPKPRRKAKLRSILFPAVAALIAVLSAVTIYTTDAAGVNDSGATSQSAVLSEMPRDRSSQQIVAPAPELIRRDPGLIGGALSSRNLLAGATNNFFSKAKDPDPKTTGPGASKPASSAPQGQGPSVTEVVKPIKMDRDLRDLPRIPNAHQGFELPELRRHPHRETETDQPESPKQSSQFFDSVRQLLLPTPNMPSLNLSFDGVDLAASGCNCSPPDTDGDVGPGNYIQAVNTGFEIWDKSGTVLQTATTFNTLWGSGGTNPCTQGQHFGDPIVFYDHVADRWVLTDFAFGTSGPNTIAPYYECVAVSQTSNPVTGGWYLYPFQVDSVNPDWLGDYPKFGMWPDAWYVSFNMFCGASSCTFGGRNSFQGIQVQAYDRTTMLTGGATTSVLFRRTPAQLGDTYTLLPGTFRFGAPPAGRNEFFASIDSPPVANAFNTLNTVHLWQFHVDFATPANSNFSGPTDVTVAGFTNAWDATESGDIVPQSGTATKLDTVGDRLFANLWYQNLGGVESLWATHTINDTAVGPTAIRWYQFNVSGGTIATSPVQQGTWDGGADTLYRFMPSLSLDKSGNMAIGYSASNATSFPSIRYNGRLTTDTTGTLGQGESTMISGTGSQTGSSRWGDYSMMTIDPTDACTLWYTDEYFSVTGGNWKTRIGNFRYAPCVAANDGTLTGTVTDAGNSNPISGATITATIGGVTSSTTTNGSGVYSFPILPGSYNMTAAKIGYTIGAANGVVVTIGNTTTQNFALVSSCSPVARTWIGAGAGGAGTDFNAAANWSPGGAPQPCDNLTMTLTSGAIITLSADTTINNLTTSVSGANNVFRLDVGTRVLTINGTTTGSAPSGNGSTQMQFNVGNSPGQIIYGGAATFSSGGSPITFPMLGIGNSTGQVTFRGNATFNSGSGTSSGNTPAKVVFDAIGTQTITDNAGASTFLLGNTSTEIGSTNSPTVVVAGSASNFQPQGNLNVNASSTLDLATKTFNRSAVGGTLTLAAGATLKLAAGSGGQTGSNFPLNFSTNTLNATSTVEYNGVVAQTVFATPVYGNLTLTGAATKTAGAGLTINGNVVINTGATFAGSTFSHIFKGNWTNSGTFSSTGTASFSGSGVQTITGATTFNNLTLANTSGGLDATAASTNLTVAHVLNMNQSTDIYMGSNVLLMSSNSAGERVTGGTGQGDVIGLVRRTSFTSGQSYGFGSPFVQFGSFTFTGAPTQIDVTLIPERPITFSQAVKRSYQIDVTSGSGLSTTLRLHYRDDVDNLNGNTEGSLGLWRGPSWTDIGATTRDAANNWVEKTAISTFSPWTLANTGIVPTAVRLTKFNAASYADGVQLNWQSGYEVDNLGYQLYREQGGKRTRVTPSVVAGSALSVGQGSRLTAGYSYAWFDPDGKADTAYYLEAIDLNGARQRLGPIFPYGATSAQPSPRSARALLLNELTSTTSHDGQNQETSWPAAGKGATTSSSSIKLSPQSLAVQQEIAAGRAVKISVDRTGWYRLTQPELLSAGLDPTSEARLLQLYVDGAEVPIRLSRDGGRLDNNDTLEFYGMGLDTPTTAKRTYWLINGSSAGKRITPKRFKLKAGDQNWTDSSGLRSFDYTTERRDKLVYSAHLLNGDVENIFGPLIFSDGIDQSLAVRNFDTETSVEPQLEVALQGLTAQAHEVRVQVNGADAGVLTFSASEHSSARFNLSKALIHSGDNTISLKSMKGDSDISLVDYLRLTYAHRYIADDNALSFSVPAGQVVRLNGFTTADLRVIDVTDPNAPQEWTVSAGSSEDGYALKVQAMGSGVRTLIAFADDLAGHPAAITANGPSNWHAAENGADLVIITHRDFKQAIEPLATERRNEGLTVAVVDVEDVYDEFSYGAHTPAALKDFLASAATSWSRKPSYVLLVGDSTWDPRNYLGLGDNDFVPTKLIDTPNLETASDDWLVDFNDSGLPALAIGRLPARTAADVSVMVSKILAYQHERDIQAPLRGAVLVADSGFESESGETAALLPPGLSVESINRSLVGNDDVMRGEILDALNQGPMIVNYYGHGSVSVWTSAAVLDGDLAGSLTNANRPSLYVMMTCLNGYAHDAYVDSLSESALKAANGGAVAVWASSGFTDSKPQSVMNEEFYRLLFASPATRLGDAARLAKGAVGDMDVRRTWMLFGDPTMRLR
jgi:hypothetical protein